MCMTTRIFVSTMQNSLLTAPAMLPQFTDSESVGLAVRLLRLFVVVPIGGRLDSSTISRNRCQSNSITNIQSHSVQGSAPHRAAVQSCTSRQAV